MRAIKTIASGVQYANDDDDDTQLYYGTILGSYVISDVYKTFKRHR